MKKIKDNHRIAIWSSDVRQRWSLKETVRLLQYIPKFERRRVFRHSRWIDRQMIIAGLLMVGTVMRSSPNVGIKTVIKRIVRDPSGRPSIPNCVDYNLTHSGGIVLLAVSEGVMGLRLGVDIEIIAEGWTELLDVVLTEPERSSIIRLESKNRAAEFYRSWTYKESVVKADGRGLVVPFNQISSLDSHCRLGDSLWNVRSLDSPPGFEAHIAMSQQASVNFNVFELNLKSHEA